MAKVTVFIINGLPGSGIATFVGTVAKYKQNVTYLHSLFPVMEIYDRIKDDIGNNTKFILDLKHLWNKYNDIWYRRFIDHLLEEIYIRQGYKTNSVIFVEINDRYAINRTKLILSTEDIEAKTILIKRPKVKYPEILSHYDLSDDYDVIIDNSGSLKLYISKILTFKQMFIKRGKDRKNGKLIL